MHNFYVLPIDVDRGAVMYTWSEVYYKFLGFDNIYLKAAGHTPWHDTKWSMSMSMVGVTARVEIKIYYQVVSL